VNTTRRTTKVLSLVAAASVAIAACGSDDDSSDTEDTTVDTEAEASEGEASEGEGDTDTTEAPADTEADAEEPAEDSNFDTESALTGLTVVDDTTFTVDLSEPDPEFNLRLAYTGFAPLPDAFYDDPGAFEEAPIGNGPFQMDGVWNHDETIKTVPFADYAGPNAPSISSLTFNLYEDTTAGGFLDLQGGAVDVVRSVPLENLGTAEAEFGDRYAQTADTGIYYYGFPSYLEEKYPLDLRRALSMAIDRELLNDVILEGANIPASSLIPPNLPGARDSVCANYDSNAEAAQAAFAEFGGLEALGDEPLVVWFNTSEAHAQIAEAITNQWREVLGIENVVFENLEFSEYLPKLDAQEITGVFRLGWGADYLSPLNFLEPLYAVASTPPVGSNTTFTDIPEFDEQLALGKAAIAESGDLADAVPFYNAAEDILCENVPSIPIYFTQNTYVWNDTVDGVVQNALSILNYSEMTGGDVVTAAGEPEHLSPINSSESEGIQVLSVLFETLVGYNATTSELENWVAESIVTEDGGQSYTITLSEGLTFHDGTPVTADSFVNAWNFAATGSNAQQNNGFFSNIAGYAELNEG